MKNFMVINGPNLNTLGQREPEVYGRDTLDDIKKLTEKLVSQFESGVSIQWYQSNSEGEIVSKIQEISKEKFTALIINPAAYSHTSVAILDALRLVGFPIVEVHLSNTHRREEFRKQKVTAQASTGILEGLGPRVYATAIISQLMA